MDQPATLEFSTTSYTSLKDCPSGFDTIDGYRLQWDDDTAIDPGTILSNIVVLAQSNQRTIRATRELFDFYGCPDVEPRLAPANAKLVEILHNISTWRTTVQADPTKPDISLPTWNEEDLKYPVAQWSIITALGGPWLSGPGFSDIDLDMVPKLIRPRTVSARGEDNIHSITTTYSLQNSDVHEYSPPPHGGDGGRDIGNLTFGPGDQIKSVAVKWSWGDDILGAFNIATSSLPDGREIPSDKWPTISPTWTKQPDTCFLGWAGIATTDVNALAVQYVKFLPCAWKEPIFGRQLVAQPPVRDKLGIYRILKTILESNWAKIQNIFNQKGGWEGWLQVELAEYLRQGYAPGWTIERERKVFVGSNERADVTLTKTGEVSYVIELKVESKYKDALSTSNLFDGIADDISKLNSQDFDPELDDVHAYALGVCVREDIAKIGEQYAWPSANLTPKEYPIGVTSAGFRLYIWAWDKKKSAAKPNLLGVVDGADMGKKRGECVPELVEREVQNLRSLKL